MGSRPESRREALLAELCVRFGFCNHLDSSALTDAMSVDEVVEAVLVAEGWNPVMCDRDVKAYLARAVVDWLFDHADAARSQACHAERLTAVP